MKGRYRHSILVVVLLLAACGVKREVSQTVGQPEAVASMSLEQRVEAGEFKWLDTIPIDTTSVWMKYYSGNYVLEHQNDTNGQRLPGASILADSLVMSYKGYYWKYKHDSLVDYGRFRVRNYAKQTICWEQYKVDLENGKVTNEPERHLIEMESSFIDCYSYNHTYHCYWVHCNHGDNPFMSSINSRQQLTIKMDVDNDCYRSYYNGCNEREWVIRK